MIKQNNTNSEYQYKWLKRFKSMWVKHRSLKWTYSPVMNDVILSLTLKRKRKKNHFYLFWSHPLYWEHRKDIRHWNSVTVFLSLHIFIYSVKKNALLLNHPFIHTNILINKPLQDNKSNHGGRKPRSWEPIQERKRRK